MHSYFLMFVVIFIAIGSYVLIPKIKLRIEKAKDSRALVLLSKLRKEEELSGMDLPVSVSEFIKSLKLNKKILEIIAYGESAGRYSKPGDEGNNAVILVGKSSLQVKDKSLLLDTIHKGKKIKSKSYVIKIRVSDDRKEIKIVDSGLNSMEKEWSQY